MSLINDALIQARAEATEQDQNRSLKNNLLASAVPCIPRRSSMVSVIVAVSLCLTLGGASWAFIRNFQSGVTQPASLALAVQLDAPSPVEAAVHEPRSEATAPTPAILNQPHGLQGVAEPEPEAQDRHPKATAGASPARQSDPVVAPPKSDPPIAVNLTSAKIDPTELPPAEAPPPTASPRKDRPVDNAIHGKTFIRSITSTELPKLTLDGIVWSASAPVALLNGSLVRPGDEVLGATILAIDPKRLRVAYRDFVFYVRVP